MTATFASRAAQFIVAMNASRMTQGIRRLGMLLERCRQPQSGKQPDWARVPARTWRRHSMLLVTLHEMHGGSDHD